MEATFLTLVKNKYPINKGHTHIGYIIDGQSGKSTKKNGHQHDIIMLAEQKTVVGPDGQPMLIAGAAKLTVLPAGNDLHTHELAELVIEGKPETNGEDEEIETVQEVYKLRKQAQDFDLESRTKAIDDEKYLSDDQWSPESRKAMKDTDRPAITVNTIRPKLAVLDGYQRSNRTDFKFYPVEQGDQAGSDISNEVAKLVCERINYWQEESRAFWQQMSVGRGFLFGFINYEKDDKGFPWIKFIDWMKVNTGPHFDVDGSDMEFFTVEDIFSKEKVIAMYPQHKDRITELMTRGGADPTNAAVTSPNTDELETTQYYVWDRSVINKLNKTITIVELHKYEYVSKYIFVDVNNPDGTTNITGMTDEMINDLKTIEGVKIITTSERRVKMIKVAGDIVLENEFLKWNNDIYVDEFSLWPIYGEKNRDQWAGKVRYVKDLADLNNKHMSLSADILNKMNHFIWFLKESMFKDPKDMQKFIRNASKPGYACVLSDDTNEKPQREQGAQYPAHLEGAIRLSLQLMDMLMNVNAELLGQPNNAQSGYQEDQRRRAAVLGNEFLFDNLSMTKKNRVGPWLLKAFQHNLGKERIGRMLNNYDQRQPVKIGGERFNKETIAKYLENIDFTKYDVMIAETSMNVSRRMANLEQLLKMAQTAPGTIPQQLIFKYMDMSDEDRKEAMMWIEQQMQQQMQLQQSKDQSEVQKTREASQGKITAELIKANAKNDGGMVA